MRLRHIPGSEEAIYKYPYVIEHPEELKNCDYINGKSEVYIEIGMGRGQFIIESAIQNPDINYIGIEMYSSVLLKACNKLESIKEERNIEVNNLKLMNIDARKLCEIFPAESIDRIYLNFSDPWPKNRHENRRLTSKRFLKLYTKVLKSNGNLQFKTDNKGLFDFSVESFNENGWKINEITYDLHNDKEMNRYNICTEYEEKFSSLGKKINKLVAVKPC